MPLQNIDKLDGLIESTLRPARIPGAAVAVVAGGATVFAKGYGYRNLEAKLPVTSATIYPIASTTKGINATLLGLLVDEGCLAWDAPVQDYLPRFRLWDPFISAQVTVRDLITMRTGLPRHDWSWTDNGVDRAGLVERLRHLDPSAGFRERFQYNNLTVTVAGHIAEVVTGQSWENLIRQRILEPLQMDATRFSMPSSGNVTLSYHENRRRELKLTRRLATELTAPSGGAIHSTVEDMARWMSFNLSGGQIDGRVLIQPRTLQQIHSPQIVMGVDPAARKPNASYAMGWTVDTYNGCARLSHGGYLHDVNTELALFPRESIGIVAFANFGAPALALLMSEHAFDLIMGFDPVYRLHDKLMQYEQKVEEIRARNAALRRVENTPPSHPIDEHRGVYEHPGYGRIDIRPNGTGLLLQRDSLVLPLQHWYDDAWIFEDNDLFQIHEPHPFDAASRLLFDTDISGRIAAISIQLEPAAAPIRFDKIINVRQKM